MLDAMTDAMSGAVTGAVPHATAIAALARRPVPTTVPIDLEYTADLLVGAYAPVRSWEHLDALAHRVGTLAWRWLVVQRRDDLGQRFVQCLRSGDAVVVEVGALDATTGRHAVWRLHRAVHGGEAPDVPRFMRIARDWLSLGVVPGYAATTVPLDTSPGVAVDDEPF